MKRNGEWFSRQLEQARAAVAEAERGHSLEEITAAEMALHVHPACPQQSIFSALPNVGLITDGQPEPSGLAGAELARRLGEQKL